METKVDEDLEPSLLTQAGQEQLRSQRPFKQPFGSANVNFETAHDLSRKRDGGPTYGAVVFEAGADVLVHDGAELGRRPLGRQLLVRSCPAVLVRPMVVLVLVVVLLRHARVHHRRRHRSGVKQNRFKLVPVRAGTLCYKCNLALVLCRDMN